tara:strand:+ start:381 stop:1502 length:1122 start_codon:yes stop_codon:yes gene_type:complete
LGLAESKLHSNAIKKIPIRIHVNGTRGKSSVTRLIAAGLRGGGIKTLAKTTGSSPRFIDSMGDDHIIQRFRPASIGEQIKIISRFSKEEPKAIVMECMAVQPQYQWVSEHKILQSNYCVITNVRADHLEEMGFSHNHIAKSLSNTIPQNQKVFTSETESVTPIIDKAINNNSEINICDAQHFDKKYLKGFPFIEHPDNIALALSVCESIGVNKQDAIKGMRRANPDPGSLSIIKLKIEESMIDFVNAFAANDPNSTLRTLNIIKEHYNGKKKIAIFLNTRTDRQLRTQQLLDLVFKDISPDYLIVRGDNLDNDILIRRNYNKELQLTLFNNEDDFDLIINKISELNDYVIVGIGNIVGWGEDFIKKLREYKNA